MLVFRISLGMRGLKYSDDNGKTIALLSHPAREAWIEICQSARLPLARPVASRGGMEWINVKV